MRFSKLLLISLAVWALTPSLVYAADQAIALYPNPNASPSSNELVTLGIPFGPFAGFRDRPVFICKARLTGDLCTALPGTIRIVHGELVQVATGDEWVLLELLKYDGQYATPHRFMQSGDRLANGQ